MDAMETRVTCYAGARYPERPRAFWYQARWLEVVEVERREQRPGSVRFRVRIADGRTFWLSYDERRDVWDVRVVRRRSQPGDSA